MKLETLVGGTQSEKPQKIYKEGYGILFGLAGYFILLSAQTFFANYYCLVEFGRIPV